MILDNYLKTKDKIIESCLFFLLIFLPFQRVISDYSSVLNFTKYFDEIFIVFGMTYFFIYKLKKFEFCKYEIYFLTIFSSFFIFGIFSGIINKAPFLNILLGTFDYIKNFLPIIFMFLLKVDNSIINKYKKSLTNLCIFLGIIAIIQFFMFLFGRYSVYELRFGIPRLKSLMDHPNSFGLYCLLILAFNLNEDNKLWKIILISIGIIFSTSRMIWFSYIFMVGYYIFFTDIRKNKKIMCYLIFLTLFFSFLFCSFFLNKSIEEFGLKFYISKNSSSFFKNNKSDVIEKKCNKKEKKHVEPNSYFRGYSLKKALEIWKDHKYIGVGPGMFGGVISIKFKSFIYEKYKFSKHWYNYMMNFNSLDQFWAQILSELGIIGLFLFLLMIFVILLNALRLFFKYRNRSDFKHKHNLIFLSFIPIVILIYANGAGLNLTSFLLTYTIFYGLIMGALKSENTSY